MKARFIGDPNDDFSGPQVLTSWGQSFEFGVWTDVTSDLGAKAATHSHFEVDANDDGEADPSIDAVRAELDALGVKYHHKAGYAKLVDLLNEHKGEGA